MSQKPSANISISTIEDPFEAYEQGLIDFKEFLAHPQVIEALRNGLNLYPSNFP